MSAPRTLRHALSRQAEVALRFYLTEVHELGAELSISGTLAPVTPKWWRWQNVRPTTTCTAATSPTAAP
jgi:phosphoenolpyruvate carboxylase